MVEDDRMYESLMQASCSLPPHLSYIFFSSYVLTATELFVYNAYSSVLLASWPLDGTLRKYDPQLFVFGSAVGVWRRSVSFAPGLLEVYDSKTKKLLWKNDCFASLYAPSASHELLWTLDEETKRIFQLVRLQTNEVLRELVLGIDGTVRWWNVSATLLVVSSFLFFYEYVWKCLHSIVIASY